MSWQFTDETRAALDRFLRAHDLLEAGWPVEIGPIGDGHSNLTYRLRGGRQDMILRRPPPPPLSPGSNDVLREAMFLSAVAPAGVPVPQVLATGQTGDVFDVPFFIMAMVDGLVVTDRLPDALVAPGSVAAMAHALVDAMAQLHGVDWAATPLSEKARPDGFNARHLRIFARMVQDADGVIDAAFAPVHDWLSANAPSESGAAVIHNDMRLGNVMWRPQAPAQLAAILDWELAAVGDPLLDLAYLISSMPRGGACHQPVQDMAAALLSDELPTAEALCARYFAQTGMPPRDIAWYRAMVNWKLAVLYRYSRLRGDDPYFADPSHETRFLAEAARFCGQ